MEAAPFMVASYSKPESAPGGSNRGADSNHMSVNPLKSCNRFVFTRLSTAHRARAGATRPGAVLRSYYSREPMDSSAH